MRFDEVHDVVEFAFGLHMSIFSHVIDDPRSRSWDESFEFDGLVLTDFGDARGIIDFERIVGFFLFFAAAEKHDEK